jgi:Pre-mRNA 3'-end-processing endonuclease polyadenylation factor C-term
VVKDFRYSLVSTELQEYTSDLVSTSIEQRQVVPSRAPFSVVKWLLECMYGKIKVLGDDQLMVSAILPYMTYAYRGSLF